MPWEVNLGIKFERAPVIWKRHSSIDSVQLTSAPYTCLPNVHSPNPPNPSHTSQSLDLRASVLHYVYKLHQKYGTVMNSEIHSLGIPVTSRQIKPKP